MQQLLCRNATLQDSLQSTPLNILQNTEYVHNDVDVEDVDDNKEGTDANFFWSETGLVRRHLAWES